VSPTQRLFRSLVGFLAGLGLLAWSAKVSLPFVGPDTSMLSFAMVLIALLGGVRLGLATAAAYVGLVMAGRLPWLGLDPSGLDLTQEQQLGYLVGLLPAALLAGALSRRNGWLRLSLAGVVGHAAILGIGVAVLGRFIGPQSALVTGLVPYAGGAIVKSLLAATLVAIFRPPIDDP